MCNWTISTRESGTHMHVLQLARIQPHAHTYTHKDVGPGKERKIERERERETKPFFAQRIPLKLQTYQNIAWVSQQLLQNMRLLQLYLNPTEGEDE